MEFRSSEFRDFFFEGLFVYKGDYSFGVIGGYPYPQSRSEKPEKKPNRKEDKLDDKKSGEEERGDEPDKEAREDGSEKRDGRKAGGIERATRKSRHRRERLKIRSNEELKKNAERLKFQLENILNRRKGDVLNFVNQISWEDLKKGSGREFSVRFFEWIVEPAIKVLDPSELRHGKKMSLSLQYAAALQLFLQEKLSSMGCNDIFDEKAGFSRIDGYLGGYSINALAIYMNKLGWDRRDSDMLWDEEAKIPMYFTRFKQSYYKGDLKNKYEEAIDRMWDETQEEEAQQKQSKPEGKKEKKNNGKKVEAPKVKKEQPKVIQKSAEKKAELTGDPDKIAKKYKLKKRPEIRLNNEQKDQKEQLLVPIQVGYGKNIILPQLSASYEKQEEDLKKLEFEKGKDPSAWFLNFDDREGSWPDIVFKEYEQIYDKSTGVIKASDSKVIDKFTELKDTVKDYHKQMKAIANELEGRYSDRVKRFIVGHDLPDKLWLGPEDDVSALREQFKKIKFNELKEDNDKNIINYLKEYFGKEIDKAPSNQAELLAMIKNKDADKMNELVNYLGNKDIGTAIDQLKEIVKYKNMFKSRDFSEQLAKDFDFDLKGALLVMDGEYNTYKAFEKQKKERNFASYIVDKYFENKRK